MHNKIFRIISTGKYLAGPSANGSEQRSVRNFNVSRNKLIFWGKSGWLSQIINGASVLMATFSSDRPATEVGECQNPFERSSTMQGWNKHVNPIRNKLAIKEFTSNLTLVSLRLQKINRTWIGSLHVSIAPAIVGIASFPFSPIDFFALLLFIHCEWSSSTIQKLTYKNRVRRSWKVSMKRNLQTVQMCQLWVKRKNAKIITYRLYS